MNQVTKLYRKIGLLDKEEDFCMFKSRYRRKNEQIETLCTLKLFFISESDAHCIRMVLSEIDLIVKCIPSLKVSLCTKFALRDHPYVTSSKGLGGWV